MRLLVTREARLLRTRSGDIHGHDGTPLDPERYLQVFDEIFVLARVTDVPDTHLDRFKVNVPGVTIVPLPHYHGPWQYLQKQRAISQAAQAAVHSADAFVLRAPGTVATLLWKALRRSRIPFGIEVVGDPWDVFAPGAVSTPLRPLLRHIFTRNLKAQCQQAAVAAYVTEFALQRRYPTQGYETHYTSARIPAARIVDVSMAKTRATQLRAKRAAGESIVMVCVGTLSQHYKAPDVLIKAAAQLRTQGINVCARYIGDGHLKPRYQRLASELGIADYIQFPGAMSHEAVIQELDNADIFVLPSRTEGLPRVVIEAMTRGLPCIATDVGGVSELLPPESLVAPNDDTGLAASLREMIEQPVDLLADRIRRNINRAHDYSLEVLNERWKQCYSKLKEITRAHRRS